MLLGMFTEVRFLQFLKASAPIDVTLSGIVMDFKPLQPENAELLMDAVPSFIVILVFSVFEYIKH